MHILPRSNRTFILVLSTVSEISCKDVCPSVVYVVVYVDSIIHQHTETTRLSGSGDDDNVGSLAAVVRRVYLTLSITVRVSRV